MAYAVAALDTSNLTCSGMAHGHVSVQVKPAAYRKVIAEEDFKPYQLKLIGFAAALTAHKADAPPTMTREAAMGEVTANVSMTLGGTTHVFDLAQPPIPCGSGYKKGAKEEDIVALVPFWYATEVTRTIRTWSSRRPSTPWAPRRLRSRS